MGLTLDGPPAQPWQLATDHPAVTWPGIYPDMDAADYHADPVPGGSLSSSGAKLLLPPSCPAKFIAERKAPTSRMEFGTAAHARYLGAGPKLCVIDAEDWRTKAAKQAAADARERGDIPVLREAAAKIDAMTLALAQHRSAAALFREGSGAAEQSLFWQDDEFGGIWRRARLDWLPHGTPGGLVIIPDYKTTGDASPQAVQRQIARLGYHLSAAWYKAGVEALRPGVETRFVLVCQETDPPYLVACYSLEGRTLEEARWRNRQACEIFRDCQESGIWPGYDPYDGITPLGLPGWAFTSEEW